MNKDYALGFAMEIAKIVVKDNVQVSINEYGAQNIAEFVKTLYTELVNFPESKE